MADSDVVAMDMSEDECATVTEVMRAFTVGLSKRQGIMGRSQAVGWTDFRQHRRIAKETMKPHMVHLQLRVNAIIKHHFPEFTWTTLMLNDSVKCQAHRDKGNVGMSVAIVVVPTTGATTTPVAAGSPAGTGSGSGTEDAAPVAAGSPAGTGSGSAAAPVAAGSPAGTGSGWLVYVDEEDKVDEVVAKPGQIAMFSGHRTHRNTDYHDKRYSIIAFHHRSFKYASEDALQQLVSLGYQLPATPPSVAAGSPAGTEGDTGDDYDGEDIWADDEDV